MNTTKKNDYKRKYAMAKHHAWAGSIFLAIVGAIRWFIDDMKWPEKDLFFIVTGIFIIIYILIALILTYKFRSGLASREPIIQQLPSNHIDQSTSTNLNIKELEKIEKKKAKAESKRRKKLAKSKQKEEKKSS